MIDWTLMRTPETAAAEALASKREAASLSRMAFAIAAKRAKIVTPQEAKDWAAGNSLPAVAVSALGTIADQDERDEAEIILLAAGTIARADPMIALLQQTAALTDAQVDALFGITD